jgi:hypothetical protein
MDIYLQQIPVTMIKWLALLLYIWEFLYLNLRLEIGNLEKFLIVFLTSSSMQIH